MHHGYVKNFGVFALLSSDQRPCFSLSNQLSRVSDLLFTVFFCVSHVQTPAEHTEMACPTTKKSVLNQLLVAPIAGYSAPG
jgi:hypothetical protein